MWHGEQDAAAFMTSHPSAKRNETKPPAGLFKLLGTEKHAVNEPKLNQLSEEPGHLWVV